MTEARRDGTTDELAGDELAGDEGAVRTAGWMTRRYLLALTMIALLAGSAFAAFEMLIAQQESTGAVVNISGRQRMLSQRTALFVQRMMHAPDVENYRLFRQKLRQATNLLEVAHRGLTRGDLTLGLPGEMSDTVRHMYFEGPNSLDSRMRRYIGALRTVIDTPHGTLRPDTPAVRYVLTEGPGPLLDSLDLMVWQYQMEGEGGVRRMQRLEAAVVALTLVILTLEALLIFRPMVRQAQHHIARNARISDALRRARDQLESQVRQRTVELEEAKNTAVRANVAKSRFLAAASHDLLQPLEAIGMFTGMLGRRAGVPEDRTILRDLRNAQRSMRTLLGSLLDISKLEAGVVEPRPVVLPLAPLLDQLGQEFWPLAEQKGLSLIVVPTSARVRTDPLLLERILRNFVSNAVRYTHGGSVLLGCRRRGPALRIEVHDTGTGIPEAEQPRIFEEFSQLEDPDRDRSEGIGLGLAIADRLARLLGHRLELHSTVGRGSVFSVTVPLAAG